MESPAGRPARIPDAWGWREDRPARIESAKDDRNVYLEPSYRVAPGANRIGWVNDDGDVYLDPHASYRAAQRFASDSDQPISHQKLAVQKMLLKTGLIKLGDEKNRYTVRRAVSGIQGKRVLDLTPLGVNALQGTDDTLAGLKARQGLDDADNHYSIPPRISVARP
jgi:hypothetical protein